MGGWKAPGDGHDIYRGSLRPMAVMFEWLEPVPSRAASNTAFVRQTWRWEAAVRYHVPQQKLLET